MADNAGNTGPGKAYNHGTETEKKGRFTYIESYGKDDSNWVGLAADERGNSGQKGSNTDLGHSIERWQGSPEQPVRIRKLKASGSAFPPRAHLMR